ncbi:glycerol-3-phosphate responsive antiterminator [Caldisalinibacter kiritimatiensis]|uniref:Glycerol uptake operon antiterminator regulatory protein n=1 Tax=Caldisalinibacter kiritimatiensis TaxID=1304284 RepID=R1CGX9_9FIRM|nr:glycerol-3-phosphate responsive antiterminator [Caldisalinibacter kiritimatiensis]EOD01555.1 Glycerol uptake operon antiterminator regulatory protein [Caldisalinibacter kiritimatiensis]
MGENFFSTIYDNPIISAVNDVYALDKAIKSPCKIIFLLAGSIFNLKQIVKKARDNEMQIYVHIDLIDGFSKDMVALRYINENIKPDGIITTKSNLIKIAKDMNLFAIQRLFILDSLSLETGKKSIRATKPDAVEILPGIMPKIIKEIHRETRIPIIAGGLIKDKEDVINSIKSGAIGISTSKENIWYL